MAPVTALLHAAVAAVATVLPLSASGHRTIALLWLGGDADLGPVGAAAALGTALALLAAARVRLGAACVAVAFGVRQPRRYLATDAGRDAAFVGLAVAASLGVELVIEGPLARSAHSALATGLGLLLTALALCSTVLAPSPHRVRPGWLGSLAVGLAHGLGMAPGISQVGAAYVVANWLGIRGVRAVELAFMVTAPALLVDGARAAGKLDPPSALLGATALLAAATAVAAAALAAAAWRRLSERGATLWLLVWLVPLALATLGWGWAAADLAGRTPPRAPRPQVIARACESWVEPAATGGGDRRVPRGTHHAISSPWVNLVSMRS